MKIKIFLSSRFNEFKDLREYIIKNGFKEIGLDIEIVALDKEPLANFLSPKEASIEGVEISNIYMLFLGKTYGTTPRDDVVSFTHREYKEAKKLGLPVLVFLTNDEKREKKVEEFIKEIDKDEIYGFISGDVKKDYELILKSLQNNLQRAIYYGFSYLQDLNKINFTLLKNKTYKFISGIGDKYKGNTNKCNLNIGNFRHHHFYSYTLFLDKSYIEWYFSSIKRTIINFTDEHSKKLFSFRFCKIKFKMSNV